MRIPKFLKSVRMKLFFTLTIVVVIIIFVLILLNNVVLETYYLISKKNSLLDVYNTINNYYNTINENSNVDLELEFEKIALNNNFDMIIVSGDGISIFSSNRNFLNTIGEINDMEGAYVPKKNILYLDDKISIKKLKDIKSSFGGTVGNQTPVRKSDQQ